MRKKPCIMLGGGWQLKTTLWCNPGASSPPPSQCGKAKTPSEPFVRNFSQVISEEEKKKFCQSSANIDHMQVSIFQSVLPTSVGGRLVVSVSI